MDLIRARAIHTEYPAGTHSLLRLTRRNNSTRRPQMLNRRPSLYQYPDLAGGAGSSNASIGDEIEERESEERDEDGDASSNWSASGILDRFDIGDEGRDADGMKRPQIKKTAPVRKQVKIAVLTGRSQDRSQRANYPAWKGNLPKAKVVL